METFDRAVTAAKAGDLPGVQALVAARPEVMEHRDDGAHSLFDHALWALLVGDWSRPPTIAPDPDGLRMAIVRFLLDAGADVNGPSQDGWTPLHTALYENHVELTEVLLERGADPTTEVHGSGGTPLVQALFWGHAAAADALAAHDITPKNLRVAAGLGRADLVVGWFESDGLLRSGAGAARGWYRPHTGLPEWTPSDAPQEVADEALCYAVRNGRTEAIEVLVARGADVDADVYGGAPLHWAAAMGDAALCGRLLDLGANVNRRATYGAQRGVTPLHCAAWIDRLDAARVLLARGADPTIEDETHGGTPLGWAEFMEAPRVADLLRARTAFD